MVFRQVHPRTRSIRGRTTHRIVRRARPAPRRIARRTVYRRRR